MTNLSDWSKIGKYSLLPFAILLSFLPLLDPAGIFSDLKTKSFDTFQVLFPIQLTIS